MYKSQKNSIMDCKKISGLNSLEVGQKKYNLSVTKLLLKNEKYRNRKGEDEL